VAVFVTVTICDCHSLFSAIASDVSGAALCPSPSSATDARLRILYYLSSKVLHFIADSSKLDGEQTLQVQVTDGSASDSALSRAFATIDLAFQGIAQDRKHDRLVWNRKHSEERRTSQELEVELRATEKHNTQLQVGDGTKDHQHSTDFLAV
jgi:hypothetical protein